MAKKSKILDYNTENDGGKGESLKMALKQI